MAGVYKNVIRDLIKQTKINTELLKETNQAFDKNDFESFEIIKANHFRRINRQYGINLPTYDYFDGTNLINSLFSRLILPVELIKTKHRGMNGTVDQFIKSVDSNSFYRLTDCIGSLINNRRCGSNENRYRRINVYQFLTHLKDALCNPVDGLISFRPITINNQDINGIFFYDRKRKRDFVATWFAYFTLEELEELLKALDQIAIMLDENVTAQNLNEVLEEFNNNEFFFNR